MLQAGNAARAASECRVACLLRTANNKHKAGAEKHVAGQQRVATSSQRESAAAVAVAALLTVAEAAAAV